MIDPFSAAAHTETRVLVTCPRFEPGFRGGGPVRSVSQIIDTAPSELDLVLVTRDRDLGGKEPYPELFGQWLARGRAPARKPEAAFEAYIEKVKADAEPLGDAGFR